MSVEAAACRHVGEVEATKQSRSANASSVFIAWLMRSACRRAGGAGCPRVDAARAAG